jgi:hypothetical protein
MYNCEKCVDWQNIIEDLESTLLDIYMIACDALDSKISNEDALKKIKGYAHNGEE